MKRVFSVIAAVCLVFGSMLPAAVGGEGENPRVNGEKNVSFSENAAQSAETVFEETETVSFSEKQEIKTETIENSEIEAETKAVPLAPKAAPAAKEKAETSIPYKEIIQAAIDNARHPNTGEISLDRMITYAFREFFKHDFQIIISENPPIAFIYDLESGLCSGFDEEGVFFVGFDYDVDDELLYATRNAWMRHFGFNEFYDWLGGALQIFDLETKRVRFTYGERDYQVQIWKGKYFFDFFMGGEIGLYYKPAGRIGTHYDCLPMDEMITMSLKLYTDDDLYFELEESEHWWIDMLRFGMPEVEPNELYLEGTMDFDDAGMADAFLQAALEQHPDITCSKLSDTKIFISWPASA